MKYMYEIHVFMIWILSKLCITLTRKIANRNKIKVTRVHRKVKYEIKKRSGENNLHVTRKEL